MHNRSEVNSEQLDQLVEAVLNSSKYRSIVEELVRNIGARQLLRGKDLRDAEKSTKDKLHQICRAYFPRNPDYERLFSRLKELKESGDEHLFLNLCKDIMRTHSSTNERLAILDEFYAEMFASLPPVESIIDVGCGLNPLSIPWMNLSDGVRYYAYDVYTDLVAFLNRFMDLIGVKGCAEAKDVTQHPPDAEADLALLLNMIPCLEQIDRSAGSTLMESLHTDFLAVSFPVQTLGGRRKRMREHYEGMFIKLAGKKNWNVKRLDFKSELLFLVEKSL